MTSLVSVEPTSSVKRLQHLPGKELERVKSEKRLPERRVTNAGKKQEDITK
jgi:hypothetical protein